MTNIKTEGYEDKDKVIATLQARIETLEAKNKGLNNWIKDLQSGLYINCVYCGHRYPPGTPDVRDKVLYEHIKQCPKHPLSKSLKRIETLEQTLTRWNDGFNQAEVNRSNKYICYMLSKELIDELRKQAAEALKGEKG